MGCWWMHSVPSEAFQKCQTNTEVFIDDTLFVEQPVLAQMFWTRCVFLLLLIDVHVHNIYRACVWDAWLYNGS